MNVPPLIHMVVSNGRATMAELETVLGIEALHDLVEILRVDWHNERVLDKIRRENESR